MLIPKNRQKILKTLRPLEDGSTFFFGLSDSRGEVVWRDGNTGEMANLTGITWAPGEPNNSGGKQDCINFEIETEDMYDTDCGQQFCPLCEVPEITAFNLQGICQNSFIDMFYVLQSATQLLGYVQNTMVWVEDSGRWDIINVITGRTEAFMNETSDFPLTTHPWYFTDGR